MPEQALGTVSLLALSTMLLVAMHQDAAHRRIPNTLVLAGALTGAGLSLMPMGIGVLSSFAGGLVGLLGFAWLYTQRLMGAGDAKLMAAVGLFVGFPDILRLCLWVFMAGGLLALFWAWRSALNPATWSPRVPYALAIAGGTWLHLLVGTRLF